MGVRKESTGDFIGWFSLEADRSVSGRAARLGYRSVRSLWGNGYATEGSRTLIRRGFTELGIDGISASTCEFDTACRRVMEKSGMTLRRTFRPTLEGLTALSVSSVPPAGIWEGDEVESVIERSDWARGGQKSDSPGPVILEADSLDEHRGD